MLEQDIPYLGNEDNLEIFHMWPSVFEQAVSDLDTGEGATQNHDGFCHFCVAMFEASKRVLLLAKSGGKYAPKFNAHCAAYSSGR